MQANGALLLETCDGSWSERLHTCHDVCEPPGGDAVVAGAEKCGAQPAIACDESADLTDQESADRVFEDLASCCGGFTESVLTVWLEGGCVTALSGRPELVECLRELTAGRRVGCAAGVSCVTLEWSTLP